MVVLVVAAADAHVGQAGVFDLVETGHRFASVCAPSPRSSTEGLTGLFHATPLRTACIGGRCWSGPRGRKIHANVSLATGILPLE